MKRRSAGSMHYGWLASHCSLYNCFSIRTAFHKTGGKTRDQDLQSSNAICTPPICVCAAMMSGVICGMTPLDVIAKKFGVSSCRRSGMMSFPSLGPSTFGSNWLRISKTRLLPFSRAALGSAILSFTAVTGLVPWPVNVYIYATLWCPKDPSRISKYPDIVFES